MAGKILVTGATGTVGSYLVRELSGRGVPVRAALHTQVKAEKLKWPNVEIAALDYGAAGSVAAALEGVERLYLLTPFVREQADIAVLLVDAAKKAGVKLIVKQSGMGADAVPGITVGRLHRQAELYIEGSGIPYAFLRPNFFMQNFVNYFRRSIREENRIYLPLGGGKVSYIDARDIARSAAAVLTEETHRGKAYNITGPAAISVHDVAGSFSRALGRTITYVDVPDEAARDAMRKLGMSGWAIESMMELHSVCKAGYASTVTDAVKAITGRDPVTFDEFARDYAHFLR